MQRRPLTEQVNNEATYLIASSTKEPVGLHDTYTNLSIAAQPRIALITFCKTKYDHANAAEIHHAMRSDDSGIMQGAT